MKVGHVRQTTILGAGAAWTWNIATAKSPGVTQIVDLYHAREHLHDLARVLEFMLGDQRDDWLAAIATTVIAGFAIITAIYAIRAFRKQSKEVSDQAEMLQVQSGQLAEQRKINEKQTEVLELQATELRESSRSANARQTNAAGPRRNESSPGHRSRQASRSSRTR